jgi:hypothetical protein
VRACATSDQTRRWNLKHQAQARLMVRGRFEVPVIMPDPELLAVVFGCAKVA